MQSRCQLLISARDRNEYANHSPQRVADRISQRFPDQGHGADACRLRAHHHGTGHQPRSDLPCRPSGRAPIRQGQLHWPDRYRARRQPRTARRPVYGAVGTPDGQDRHVNMLACGARTRADSRQTAGASAPQADVIAIWIKKNRPEALPACAPYGCSTASWQAGMAMPTDSITTIMDATSDARFHGARLPSTSRLAAPARLSATARPSMRSAPWRGAHFWNSFDPVI